MGHKQASGGFWVSLTLWGNDRPHAHYDDDLIYYEKLFAGDGPPLVLLTGMLGHGLSSKPDDAPRYTRKHRAGNIAAVLDELEDETAHLYGYSMGDGLGPLFAKAAIEIEPVPG